MNAMATATPPPRGIGTTFTRRRPGSSTAWEQLGSTYENMKEWDEAAEAYRKAVERDPLNSSVRKSRENFEKRREKEEKK